MNNRLVAIIITFHYFVQISKIWVQFVCTLKKVRIGGTRTCVHMYVLNGQYMSQWCDSSIKVCESYKGLLDLF